MVLSKVSIVTCACSTVSFIGQLLSVCFPRWWKVETVIGNVTETAHFGIWVTVDCLNKVCTEELSNAKGDKGWIQGMKAIEIVAVIFLFASIVVSAMSLVSRNIQERLTLLKKLFTAFSGAAGTIIVMGVLIFYIKKAGLSPSQAIATKDGTAGWALIISSISGVLSFVCAVFVGCKLILNDSDIDDNTDYSHWYSKYNIPDPEDKAKSHDSDRKKEMDKF